MDETDAFVDNNQLIKVERAGETFEWARLRLLDTKIVDEMLSASEISAVTAHLKTNHAKCFKLLTDMQLTGLVSSTPVTTFPTATQDLDKELPNELLYEKNVSSDTFTLILSGKVTIFVGSENFRSDISSWSVMGSKALEDKQWAPDYSAFVSDGPCRCIQIHRDDFIESSDADASVFEHRIPENKIDAALSVTSSTDGDGDGDGDGISAGESGDGESARAVAPRRQTVLARLFHGQTNVGEDGVVLDTITRQGDDDKKSKEGLPDSTTSVVHFDKGDVVAMDKEQSIRDG